ncbi:hypothetical protein DFH07DRAFT_966920 [Mycena maculata]|uniref:Uncharacterized protein n=1 Tax=Mycena maculata TaxID=230809 RepID=A0AAD7MWV8_9AGAR|nr:hypothetical protein DFH07DRAFT_966920 [Mycena maculata]
MQSVQQVLFNNQPLHVLGNIFRIFFTLLLSPLYLFTPRAVVTTVDNYIWSGWLLEFATTPDSFLSHSRGGGKGHYDVTGFQPSWVLEVTIHGGLLHHFHQIPFSEDEEAAGYTVLSYLMKSADVLFREAGFVPGPAPEGREYTLSDRRNIAEQLLRLYCSTHCPHGFRLQFLAL